MTTKGIKERDYHVVRTCVNAEIPIAVVVGGGYDNDVREPGRRHAIVHRTCAGWREKRRTEGKFEKIEKKTRWNNESR